MDMTKNRLVHNIDTALRAKGINMEDELLALSNSPDVADPFSSFNSEYLQKQYFIKHLHLVVSVT